MSGIWVGVCEDKLPLGRSSSLSGLSRSTAKIWFWHCDGSVYQNVGPNGTSSRSARSMREGDAFRLRLDCDDKTLQFFIPADSDDPVESMTLQGVEGTSIPLRLL